LTTTRFDGAVEQRVDSVEHPPDAVMRVLRDATEEEMIEAFVLAELESSRHGQPYPQLALGDLSRYEGPTPLASALRRVALFLFRGYGQDEYLFAGFPTHATWKLVAVPIAELREWLYAHEPTWLALSESTRLVRVGARNVGKVHQVQDASDCILAVEQDVRNGKTYQPIIAAALSESSPHVIAEGHTRATAYVRALNGDVEVEVIVGYSPGLVTWRYYGRP
jgi:hypothetical protein